MNALLRTPLGRFRAISLLEGLSYLLLLGIAMPLKYLAGRPEWVRVMGSLHGVLFVLFVVALWQVVFDASWSVRRALVAFLSSLVPFGALWLERSLRKEVMQ